MLVPLQSAHSLTQFAFCDIRARLANVSIPRTVYNVKRKFVVSLKQGFCLTATKKSAISIEKLSACLSRSSLIVNAENASRGYAVEEREAGSEKEREREKMKNKNVH